MKDELVASMRIAMDRGAPLEEIVQSFLNAGYNPQEVKAAEEVITSGAMNIIYKETSQQTNNGDQTPSQKDNKNGVIVPKKSEMTNAIEVQAGTKKSENNKKTMIIIIVVVAVLLLLLGVLGFLAFSLLNK